MDFVVFLFLCVVESPTTLSFSPPGCPQLGGSGMFPWLLLFLHPVVSVLEQRWLIQIELPLQSIPNSGWGSKRGGEKAYV